MRTRRPSPSKTSQRRGASVATARSTQSEPSVPTSGAASVNGALTSAKELAATMRRITASPWNSAGVAPSRPPSPFPDIGALARNDFT